MVWGVPEANRTSLTREHTDLESREDRDRLTIAPKAAKICVFEVDILNQLYTYFENAEDIFGVSGEVILKGVRPYSELEPEGYRPAVSGYFAHPDDCAVIDEAFQCIFQGKPTTYQARIRAGGSDYIWCKLDVTPVIENGIPVKMIGVITDITNRKAKTDHLEEEARLDRFTGLYNKKYSTDRIRRQPRENFGQQHALVLMDADNFKYFNDTYGHAIGDFVIKAVADKLKDNFRKNDIIGRFSGDEFILFIQDVPDMERFMEKLQSLVTCERDGDRCTNSVGISMFPQDTQEFEVLFQKADEALCRAKLRKASYVFYSESDT